VDNGILVRYSAPTKFDYAEYGQIWRQLLDHNSYEHYIQVSKESESPSWIAMGTFLEKALENNFCDDLFIKNCLKDYESKITARIPER